MKLFKRYLNTLVTAAAGASALAAFATPVSAGSPAKSGKSVLPEPVVEQHPMYLGTFNTGVKTSDVYTEGNLSFVIPVWSSIGTDGYLGGGTLFVTPYASLGEQGELATSFGLGWRYLFNDQPVSALKAENSGPVSFLTEGFYIGANVFVDNLETQFNNDFWQMGFGLEIGTRYLELRGNYYLPFDGGQKLAQRTTDTRNFTTQNRSSRTSYSTTNQQVGNASAAPFATGHSIQQDVNLTNISTTTRHTTTAVTTTKTTVRTITSLFEEGMEGWDVEAAFLIPGLDKYLDVSVLAGYYAFDNQPFGPQNGGSGKTEGFKLGLEVRPVPALVLTATWYEDEGLTGSDWVVGAGLQIPLGKEWKDAFKPRRRHLLERLAEPVARQNAAIKTALSYDVDQNISQTSSTRTSTSSAVVQQTVIQTGTSRIVIAEDIIFVNNGGAVGNGIQAGTAAGNGTAENPVNTIQAGADIAGNKNVSTQRIWNVYTQGGTGTPYTESVTISGSTKFSSSYMPIVSPQNGVKFGGNTARPKVQGGFAANAPYLPGSTTPTTVSISGYDISGGYNSAASVSKNAPGVAAADGSAIYLHSVKNVEVVSNVISDVLYGFYMYSVDSTPHHVSILNNVISDTVNDGIYAYLGDGVVTGTISGNKITDAGDKGINLEVLYTDFIGNISHNEITNSNDDSIYVYLYEGDFIGNIDHNIVDRSGDHGINVDINTGSFRGDVAYNTVTNGDDEGIQIDITSGDFIGNIVHNISNGTTDEEGIYINVFEGNFIGDIAYNTTNNNDEGGLEIDIYDGDFIGHIHHNIAIGNKDDGFDIAVHGNFTGGFYNNYAEKNNQHGIEFHVQSTFAGAFNHNTAINNNIAGFYYGFDTWAGTIDPSSVVSPNTATGNNGSDIRNNGVNQIAQP